MTEEEYEQKAEEYKKKLITENKSLIPNEILYLSPIKQAYKDGYKQGQKDTFNTYNDEVTDMSNDYSYRLKKLVKEQEKLRKMLNLAITDHACRVLFIQNKEKIEREKDRFRKELEQAIEGGNYGEDCRYGC